LKGVDDFLFVLLKDFKDRQSEKEDEPASDFV